jgi:hypothetical protein
MVGSAVRPLCQAWPAHVTDSVNVMATNLTRPTSLRHDDGGRAR